MSFKKGDRVRVCKDMHTDWFFKKGDIGTLVSIDGSNCVPISINFDAYLDCHGHVDPDMIELITVSPPCTNVAPRGSDLFPATEASTRTFGTGATRDLDANKLDYEGFLSPLVMKRYGEHMHKARKMPDGTVRDSDNWQLGIPVSAYMKSLWRHFYDVWARHRGYGDNSSDIETELCALLFNTNGMLHELLKAKREL